MSNPFDVIIADLQEIKSKLAESPVTTATPQAEIIGRSELCKRLSISEPTAIRWEKKGKIPCFHIGSSVRYNWQFVIDSLTKK